MNIFASIKNFFKIQEEDKNHSAKRTDHKNEAINQDDAGKDKKEKELSGEKAHRAYLKGNYQLALSLWNEFAEKYPANKPQAMVERARIYIIKKEEEKAKIELLDFFSWYVKKGNFAYNSQYFTIFISALQDLGYLIGTWPDSNDYLKNIAGKDISLARQLTVKRIKKGLQYLKEQEIWSKEFKKVNQNIDLLF